jgi:hypothetical protein
MVYRPTGASALASVAGNAKAPSAAIAWAHGMLAFNLRTFVIFNILLRKHLQS